VRSRPPVANAGAWSIALTRSLLGLAACLAPTCAPDKNPDRMEEATRLFAELQNAYAVISDPHERAWYDGHREQILREGAVPVRTGCPPPGTVLDAPVPAVLS